MGCCGSKRSVPTILPQVELPRQENIIEKAEKLIPFSQKHSKDLDSVLKSMASGGRMSVPQLKKALGVLELDPQVFTDPDTQVYKFLNRLQNEKKLYDIKKLGLCSILLGEGETPIKARILFNHFDEDANEKFDRAELRSMLDEMVQISVHLIPMLALRVDGESDDPNMQKISQEEIDDYTKVLDKSKEKFIETVSIKLLGTAEFISSEEFITKVSNDNFLKRIVWSSNIRVTLFELSKGVGLN